MSRYQPSYDSGESRRSPRDQSPGRYNDSRDEYRGGSGRGVERRRSISNSRANHNAFASNRDTFREPISRESSRDFSTREPPRGPKGLIDAPTGPRASNYPSEFRSDFSFRGDFRGDRGGRGRGRGWRDDSRDRGREGDRDYRDRRDDRAPAPFRDDRGGRERWGRENSFRGGRRPSSPQGRGRSPNYGPRDTRDPLPALDIDRTRRGSRDPPLSVGSPSSDSLPYRGYGRGRGGRGRGRGGFYDDHRPLGRSRSPEPSWNRRTQPSATPPPQVPAFGSTSSNVAVVVKPPTSPVAMLTGNISGPVPGVAVPTAPRSLVASSQIPRPRHHTGSATWINPQLKVPHQNSETGKPEIISSIGANGGHSSPRRSTYDLDANHSPQSKRRSSPRPQTSDGADLTAKSDGEVTESRPAPRRRPVIGRRPLKAPLSVLPNIRDESSSDSGDDFDDNYFENEIAKIKSQMAEISDENPLAMPSEIPLVFLQPFIHSNIDDLVTACESAPPEPCEAANLQQESIPEPPMVSPTLTAKSIPETSRSHPRTPTPVAEPVERSDINGIGAVANGPIVPIPAPEEEEPKQPSVAVPVAYDTLDADFEVDDIEEPIGPASIAEHKPVINGNARIVVPMMNEMEEMDYSDDESRAENLEALEAVRKYMATPPISDLPNFNTKPWHQDEAFLRTLAPRPDVEACIRHNLEETAVHRHEEQEEERHRWMDRYLEYRRWTDFSHEDAPVRSRVRFEKSRAEAAAAAAAPHPSSMPSAGAKPEGGRRIGRFATEHDIERVLRQSEQEAKEKKEVEERATRAKTASAKEASIPDMAWDDEEWNARKFIDRTHLVPFERSFARLEMSEPIDNFTVEENQMFESAYLEFPKQWGKIADTLPGRDYKACIQHYYLVKHSSKIKEKLKKQPKKRKGRRKAAGNPKSNALMADLEITIRDEGDDAVDAENGERRRPRRAAAPTWPFETPASESEVASPAPTPGRKSAAALKPEAGTDAPPPKTRKTKVPREKAVKQAKNSLLLAAAPATVNRQAESPATPASAPDWKIRHESAGSGASPGLGVGVSPAPPGPSRFPPQYDGTGPPPAQFASPFIPVERPNPSMNVVNFELMSQQYPTQERLGSAPPMGFDPQQDRRNVQQTSSYWSVPEQNDFPALLKHFGTDWHGIAKHMTTKTHIMVYTTVFQQWLAVPSDSNKSRRVANIQTQVKNYYQRQVDSGSKREWEDYAKEAEEKRARGEPVGPLPNPIIIPKRRYDLTPGANGRPGSAMDGCEEMIPLGSTSVPPQVSPPQPPTLISSRFPALAQAGPVPQIQPATPTSAPNMPPQQVQHQVQVQQAPEQPTHQPIQQPMQQAMQHSNQPAVHQPIQQAIRQAPTLVQQVQPIRGPRGPGPVLGYFPTDPSSRPMSQVDSLTQRSLMAAQEAQLERQAALRMEREQILQREQAIQREQQVIQREQQQAMQREANQREMNQRETGQRETNVQREAVLREQRQQAMHREALQRETARQQEAVLREQALQREQSQALAIQQRERERVEQQQQTLQRERQFHLKQENEIPNLRQYEAYTSPTIRNGNAIQSRPEVTKSVVPPTPEPRRPVQQQQQQYQPRNPARNLLSENGQGAREIKSMPSPAIPRPPMSAPPTSHEQYAPPLTQSAPVAAARPEVRKTVSVMSLLNDEPSEPRPTPTKRVSDVSSSSLQPSRTPPPPQHSLQPSRYTTHPPPQSQGSQHMQQQIPSQQQHSYAQPTPHSMHQHSSSIGHSRSYTPNSFEGRNYPSSQPQQQQQQLYSQAPRQSLPPQPQNFRRESSISDMHGLTGGYSRSSGSAQSRLKESPYLATPPPQAPQPVRHSAASPIDMPADRDYYQQRPSQAQYMVQQPQSSGAGSPQLGPTYHPQSQPPPPPPPSHRQYAFSSMQSQAHVASPQPQFSAQHQLHRSRHNSFDGRPPHMASTSAPPPQQPAQQGYSQAPPYQNYPPPQHHPRDESRFANPFDRERERRLHDEAYHRRMQDDQRRMDERR